MDNKWWLLIGAFAIVFIVGFVLALNTARGRKTIADFTVAFVGVVFGLAARLAESLLNMVVSKLEPPTPAEGVLAEPTEAAQMRRIVIAAREGMKNG